MCPSNRTSQAIHVEPALGPYLAHCDQLAVAGYSAGKVISNACPGLGKGKEYFCCLVRETEETVDTWRQDRSQANGKMFS